MAHDKNELNMADRRRTIEQIYSSEITLRNLMGATNASTARSLSERELKQLLDMVGSSNFDRKKLVEYANHAYATEPLFAEIIDYLANMFLWRYYYVPIKIRETAKDADYKDVYDLAQSIVDGISFETILPQLLTEVFKSGIAFIYTEKNTSSKTVSTILLSPQHCKPVTKTQYGTGTYSFDLKYFEDARIKLENEEVLRLFPVEIVKGYLEYKRGGPREILLDGRYATYISANEAGFPPLLLALKSILDYDKYRQNELERNSQQLEKIIVHRIPSYENRLLFDMQEVSALHKSMSRSLTTKTTKLMTTFGDTNVLPLQKDSEESLKVLKMAQEAVINAVGLNPNLFSGTTEEALRLGLTKDQSTVWKVVEQIMNFYNLTINNLFNFKGFQIEVNMLPITHYNLKESMELYRRSAEYGIGKLEAIVASGTKQRHIKPKADLEEFLDLDNILKPLQSSHTRSAEDIKNGSGENEKEENESEDEESLEIREE